VHAKAFFPNRGRLALLLFVLLAALCGTGAFAQRAAGDPPGRVAQLNAFDGPVSFAPAGFDQWAGAVLNRPLTQGDRLWNDTGARSELHIGSTALRLDGQTSLAFSVLDDQTVQLALSQGSLIVRLRSLPPGQRFEVDTPNLAFTASQPGDYRLDVDPSDGTTRVTVRSGSAVVYGSNGASASLGARQQISFAGADLVQAAGQTAPALDPFDRWAEARDRAEDQSLAARHVSRDVIGYQQLDNYGDWESDPVYGTVWVPHVTVQDWAPYRVGHWASIAPWGWTWIDDEPWGFAPFHYGRWAQRGARWCWVPGASAAHPVYAPALVGFVGGSVGGVNFAITVGGATQPGVAWFPLAPGEAWRPSYRASRAYLGRVNPFGGKYTPRNTANANNSYRYQHLPAAVTAVTAAAFSQGQHVRGSARPVAARELERARVVAPPTPTRDPRSVFGASRLTQAHPAPPAAAVERRVVSNPAFSRGRAEVPPRHEALSGPSQRPELARGAAAPNASHAPAMPVVRPPQASVPPSARERHEPPPRNAAMPPPRPEVAAPQDLRRPPARRPEQGQREQNTQRDSEMRNEQAARAAQKQEQRAQQQHLHLQQEQQMQQRAQQARQPQPQPQAQRAQQEPPVRQAPRQAQRQQPAQAPRGAQAPENRDRHGGPRREEHRPGQDN